MTLSIRSETPFEPQALQLLRDSHALMEMLFPADENHHLDAEALAAPEVSFFVAETAGTLLGCIALMRGGDYAEIKSFFVAPEARGIGVGKRLLEHVEAVAREEGIAILKLETGDKLRAAGHLYRRHGYLPTGPFGAYRENGSSRFFEKPLLR